MSTSVIMIGVFGVIWGAWGVLFVVEPATALAWTKQLLFDVRWRFGVALVALLIGLLLIIDTSHFEWPWLWMACGGIAVVKGCLLLGASESFRERLWQRFAGWPNWLLRCDGLIILALAVLLVADVVLHG